MLRHPLLLQNFIVAFTFTKVGVFEARNSSLSEIVLDAVDSFSAMMVSSELWFFQANRTWRPWGCSLQWARNSSMPCFPWPLGVVVVVVVVAAAAAAEWPVNKNVFFLFLESEVVLDCCWGEFAEEELLLVWWWYPP